ncbi:toxin-antitoxin system HicB family antitoxin [Bacteroides pyogenes]|jgi:hypothetical protein|uniref:Toxin-antitoxin system HicB family antitoxin n=1 Tax=Bacteroides pyogenes TaxID=310300 RepID=A0A5D3E9H6_9BACE|nr:toxin-antitoxin system HicB family antitoxin [Bacteroides pyogenes]TYK32813.1 toxin-antitoxin system HicB family antitoxin [Bacteroides pyogenes]
MKVTTKKKQTCLRLNADLLQKLHVAARKDNRSLNNYVENVLMNAVEVTQARRNTEADYPKYKI